MKKGIIFVMFLLMFPLSVYADSITLDCPSKVNNGEQFSCELSGTSENLITSISAEIANSSNVSFISFVANDIWKGDGANKKIELYTEEDVTGNFKIGIIKFKSTSVESANVMINTVFFYDDEDNEITIDFVSKTIEVSENMIENGEEPTSENNSTYLVDILIENYSVDFDKETFEYTLDIQNEESLVIEPILEDTSSTSVILGNEKLTDGKIINIVVTSVDGEKRVYSITIHKTTDNEVSSNNVNNNYTVIFVIIILVLVGINIIRIVFNKKKKS